MQVEGRPYPSGIPFFGAVNQASFVFANKQHLHKNNFVIGALTHEKVAPDLREYIDPEVAAALTWTTFKVESGNFVDSALQNRETDILYSVKLGEKDAYIYVLLEHQSEEDWRMPFRLLSYMLRIWEQFLKQNTTARELPVILPIVLFQGEKQWKPSMDFADYFDLEDDHKALFSRYIPNFLAEMISLPSMTDEQINGGQYIRLVFSLMKAIRNGTMLDCIEASESMMEFILEQEKDVEFIAMCLTYALHADGVDIQAVRDKFNYIQNPQLRQTAMTAAQQLIDEGRQEGRQEGLSQRGQEDVIDALEIRFEIVPEGLKEAIRSVFDDDKLRGLLRSAIKCSSIEGFTNDL